MKDCPVVVPEKRVETAVLPRGRSDKSRAPGSRR